ncbi:hypothetical protein ml_466 [Mollivirus sibericum]|uniref:hypothetical protein n=1 Tax=Mollivirus sibericum TaxID=1678078 RepID=UPI0006B2DA3F|nr:hypothetical protein ml_466 [Mollivirus sibericum]ALD62268.1 hypothetical protein ml_466 [Mollivirus sibericum]
MGDSPTAVRKFVAFALQENYEPTVVNPIRTLDFGQDHNSEPRPKRRRLDLSPLDSKPGRVSARLGYDIHGEDHRDNQWNHPFTIRPFLLAIGDLQSEIERQCRSCPQCNNFHTTGFDQECEEGLDQRDARACLHFMRCMAQSLSQERAKIKSARSTATANISDSLKRRLQDLQRRGVTTIRQLRHADREDLAHFIAAYEEACLLAYQNVSMVGWAVALSMPADQRAKWMRCDSSGLWLGLGDWADIVVSAPTSLTLAVVDRLMSIDRAARAVVQHPLRSLRRAFSSLFAGGALEGLNSRLFSPSRSDEPDGLLPYRSASRLRLVAAVLALPEPEPERLLPAQHYVWMNGGYARGPVAEGRGDLSNLSPWTSFKALRHSMGSGSSASINDHPMVLMLEAMVEALAKDSVSYSARNDFMRTSHSRHASENLLRRASWMSETFADGMSLLLPKAQEGSHDNNNDDDVIAQAEILAITEDLCSDFMSVLASRLKLDAIDAWFDAVARHCGWLLKVDQSILAAWLSRSKVTDGMFCGLLRLIGQIAAGADGESSTDVDDNGDNDAEEDLVIPSLSPIRHIP